MVARTWGPGYSQQLGKPFPDCARCRRPGQEKARESWGCDAPASAPVFEVTCSACGGNEVELDNPDGHGTPCPKCDGEGVIQFHRCPTAVIREAHPSEQTALDSLMRAYIQYDNRNVMPVPGGSMDQSAYWGRCIDIIDAERGVWERKVQDKHERDRVAAEKKAAANRGGSRGNAGRVHRPVPPPRRRR